MLKAGGISPIEGTYNRTGWKAIRLSAVAVAVIGHEVADKLRVKLP